MRACAVTVLSLFTSVFAAADSLHTPFEAISFVTADGINISARVARPHIVDKKIPAVIFIHQGGSSKEEWTSTPLFSQVASHGMLALAYDVRGHGESGGEADFSTLFDDPKQAPLDLEAALAWIEATGVVDMDRVAVVGASIGANLAVVAAGSRQFDVRTAVAISGKTSAVFHLAGGEANLSDLDSVFMIAAEFDQNGQRAAWASELFDRSAKPRRLEIVKGSGGHGVAVFDHDPTLTSRIMEWLRETL